MIQHFAAFNKTPVSRKDKANNSLSANKAQLSFEFIHLFIAFSPVAFGVKLVCLWRHPADTLRPLLYDRGTLPCEGKSKK